MYKVVDRAPPVSGLTPRTTRGFATLTGALVVFLLVTTVLRWWGAPTVSAGSVQVPARALSSIAAAQRTAWTICADPHLAPAWRDAANRGKKKNGAPPGRDDRAEPSAAIWADPGSHAWPAAAGVVESGPGRTVAPPGLHAAMTAVVDAGRLDGVLAAEAGGIELPAASWRSWLHSVSVVGVIADDGPAATRARDTGAAAGQTTVERLADAMRTVTAAADDILGRGRRLVRLLSANYRTLSQRSGEDARTPAPFSDASVARVVPKRWRNAVAGKRLAVIGNPCAAVAACAAAEFSSCRTDRAGSESLGAMADAVRIASKAEPSLADASARLVTPPPSIKAQSQADTDGSEPWDTSEATDKLVAAADIVAVFLGTAGAGDTVRGGAVAVLERSLRVGAVAVVVAPHGPTIPEAYDGNVHVAARFSDHVDGVPGPWGSIEVIIKTRRGSA